MLLGYFIRYKDQVKGWTIEKSVSRSTGLIFSPEVHTEPGTHPASYWVPLALTPGAKRLEFVAGLSPPSGAKLKYKYCIDIHLSPLYLHGIQTDIFTCTLLCWSLIVSIVTNMKLDMKKVRQANTNFVRSVFYKLTITNTASVQNYEALPGELNTSLYWSNKFLIIQLNLIHFCS